MNELRAFEISKKRTLIAMQEWLRSWQMPLITQLSCPNCKSQKVGKRMKAKQGKRFHCSECHQDFSMEELAECRCTYPGALLKCIDCKHYKDMMLYVQRRKPQLENLGEDQLDAIISASDFWQRDMERRSSELQDTSLNHVELNHIDWMDTDQVQQLSLLELLDNKFKNP
jgi:hypothetical protein